jgi:hypothetical protein
MIFKRLLGLGFLACVGCVPAAPPVTEMEPAAVDALFHGDTRFDRRERQVFESKLEAFRVFTEGRVRLGVTWDLDEENYMGIVLSGAYTVLRSPATYAGKHGGKTEARMIRLVPDVCMDFGACALHELGHFVGFEHVKVPGSVMSEKNPGAVFTVADRAQCVQLGLCSRAGYATTVTLTVDKDIPNVGGEYPSQRRDPFAVGGP